MEGKLTIAEAAKALNTSYSTMYSRVQKGYIPVEKDGFGNVLIDARHIQTILNWRYSFRTVIQTCLKGGRGPLSLYEL